MKKNGFIALALIPVILTVFEIIMWFSSLRFDHGVWVSDGVNWIGFHAIMGFFFLPFILLIPEIIGLVLAIKRKMIGFRIIYIIELLLTTVFCVISAYEFHQGLSI
ncbi:MAG: hypothetical protein IKC40_06685 [Oscillospiraceae bacterium]|nr:hypothetical protein [Oscillospiraceae bacterium]MBR6616904.1 hypothetical protein [Oscillospiraceae bacterium]